ncbi:MAG: proline--tRNA ligase [Caldisericia bacterium]
MRTSKFFAPTLREVPVEAEAVSHKLMLRAALIRKLSAGIYTLLPLGKKVLENITKIVRDEMDDIGCQEILMPALLPAEPWQESGRWDVYGGEMFRINDRKGREFCLGPTHEEIVTLHVRDELKSYRQMPLMLYQIQTKYRDERRPRFGVIRAREFLMKDMYSFDVDEEAHEKSYKIAYDSYCRIFEKCGVSYIPVEADTGAIGGSASHEFVVEAENGECRFAHCKACGYSANTEIAKAGKRTDLPKNEEVELKLVDTPDAKTIEEVSSFLSIDPKKLIKAIIYKVDKEFVMALVRGDDEISEVKLQSCPWCGSN